MRSQLIEALEHVAADKAIKALVLTGAGKGFCAGGDISGMERAHERPGRRNRLQRLAPPAARHHTQSLLHTMPKPTIAAVNGAASGLGADLALACDFIIACECASFAWSYIAARDDPGRRRHVLPAAPRRSGEGQGADLHRPQGRCRRGALARHRRPQGSRLTLLADAQAWAAELGKGSATALALTKRSWTRASSSRVEDVFAQGSQAQGSATRAPSTASRSMAFLKPRRQHDK